MRTSLLATLVLLACAPTAYAQDAKPVAAPAATAATEAPKPIAIVNGKEIPAIYGELIKREMVGKGQPDTPQLDARVRESLISLKLLSLAAQDKGLDKDPRIAAALDLRRMDALAKLYLEDYVKNHPITDAEMQAEYDKAKAAASGSEYRARHILVKDEAEARKLTAELGKKAKFEDMAKKYSKDTGSAKNGGDLNWADSSAFVKEFSEAMVALKKGEYTKTPVKTQFGWHIIKLEDSRPMQFPPLDSVKDELRKDLQQKRGREAIAAARAGAKIE
jgi:peptidyl-prolyl cis-trans isomerase C